VPAVSEACDLSLLAKATREAVAWEPFPHLVIRDALPADACAQLLDEMPPLDVLAEGRALGSNERVSYPCHSACANPVVSRTWKRFLQEHVSQSFLDRLMQVFGPALTHVHPRFEQRCARVDRLRAGVRGIDDLDRVDVLLDAQVCANSPV